MQHRTISKGGSPSLFGAKITGGGSGGTICVIGKNCSRSSEEIVEVTSRTDSILSTRLPVLYCWILMMFLALNVYSDSAEVQGCYRVPAHPFRRVVSRSCEVWLPENPAAAFLVANFDKQRIWLCCCVTVLHR